MHRLLVPLMAAFFLLATVEQRPATATALNAQTMKIALKTATPEEEGFIQYVLDRVDRGTLPLDLVESTFLWAKKKPRYQFQYFKRGLILRAARRGIVL